MLTKDQDFKDKTIEQIAQEMCLAARTAPKAKGLDFLEIAFGIPLSASAKNPFFDRK